MTHTEIQAALIEIARKAHALTHLANVVEHRDGDTMEIELPAFDQLRDALLQLDTLPNPAGAALTGPARAELHLKQIEASPVPVATNERPAAPPVGTLTAGMNRMGMVDALGQVKERQNLVTAKRFVNAAAVERMADIPDHLVAVMTKACTLYLNADISIDTALQMINDKQDTWK